MVGIVYEGIGIWTCIRELGGLDNLPHEAVMFRYNVGLGFMRVGSMELF